MNMKLALISLLFISTSISLFSCNSSTVSTSAADNLNVIEASTSDITEVKLYDNINSSIPESKNITDSRNNKSNNIQPINIINTTSTQNEKTTNAKKIKDIQEKNDDIISDSDTVIAKNPIIYTSKAGFSMIFPRSWEGKYTVEENTDGLSVIFKSSDPENKDFVSWMISINKSDNNDIPCYGLAAQDIQNFDANGNHYIVFMPNDLTLDCARSDYKEYIKMMAECESVINSITITK